MFRKSNRNALILAAATLGVGTVFCSDAGAVNIITSNNSTLAFDISDTSFAPFITQWTVDGINQFGGSPSAGEYLGYGANGDAYTINNLALSSSSVAGNIATVTYTADDSFTVTVKDILLGGNAGSGASSISETITVTNIGASAMNFGAGQYVHLTLDGLFNNDSVTLSPATGTNTATQTNSLGTTYTDAVSPTPDEALVSNSGIPGLTNSLGPVTGDVSFGFAWDPTIAPGDDAIYSITETLSGVTSGPGSVVPLPNSAWSTLASLAGLGAIGIVRRTRRTA
jgi:hypothetical protein